MTHFRLSLTTLRHAACAVLLLTLTAVLTRPAAAQPLLFELLSPNEETGGGFGDAVAAVPDADGDGFSDVLIAAAQEDPDSSPDGAGRAYLYSGASGVLLFELRSPNEQTGGRFGRSVAGVPDTDGDGRGDLLIGADREDPGGSPSRAGRAYLFSGATGALLFELQSPNEESNGDFGYLVAGVPDANGDGRGDLLITAPFEETGSSPTSAGRAYLFSGATGALLHELQSPNEEPDGRFGSNDVAGVPDTNGDERGDLLVTARLEDPGTSPTNAGRAYLFSGATGTLLHELQSPNEEAEGRFGFAAAGVPDADGDGRGDLLIGARFEDPGVSPSDAGRGYLFSGATGLLLFELQSPNEESGGYFGQSVASVPDVDGDGRGDLLVGASREDPGTSPQDAGRAYLFSGISGTLLREIVSPNEEMDGNFGDSTVGLLDADGDGRGDLLIGARNEDPGASPTDAGRAYLFSGASGSGFNLTAMALDPLTVITGGSIRFTYTVTNNTDNIVFGDLYYVARDSTSGAVVAQGVITSGTLGAGETAAGTFTQSVPNGAQAGSYTYEVRIGQFPSAVADTETFTLVVIPAARMRGRAAAWSVTDASPWLEAGAPALAAGTVAEGLSAAPNPFVSATTLRFALEAPAAVRLVVYDALGREVARLADSPLEAGTHAVGFDGSGLPSGVYVWQLEAGERVETGRLTLLR